MTFLQYKVFIPLFWDLGKTGWTQEFCMVIRNPCMIKVWWVPNKTAWILLVKSLYSLLIFVKKNGESQLGTSDESMTHIKEL